MPYRSETYQAEIEIDEQLPCTCGSCDWVGTVGQTKHIEGCALTPGDESPVGRCPTCDALTYILKKET